MIACGVGADQEKIFTGCREHGRASKQASEMLTKTNARIVT
jgi:hypothetical protein